MLKFTDVSSDATDDSPPKVGSPHADDFLEPVVAEDFRSSSPAADSVPVAIREGRLFGLAPIPSPSPTPIKENLHAPSGSQPPRFPPS